MRELNNSELKAVSGGEVIVSGPPLMTLSLIALSPTPLVIAVGAAALLYYAFC